MHSTAEWALAKWQSHYSLNKSGDITVHAKEVWLLSSERSMTTALMSFLKSLSTTVDLWMGTPLT